MLPSASVASSRIDKEFLEKVTGIIESRMIDSDFSVDVLAQEIGISRNRIVHKTESSVGYDPERFYSYYPIEESSSAAFSRWGAG